MAIATGTCTWPKVLRMVALFRSTSSGREQAKMVKKTPPEQYETLIPMIPMISSDTQSQNPMVSHGFWQVSSLTPTQ